MQAQLKFGRHWTVELHTFIVLEVTRQMLPIFQLSRYNVERTYRLMGMNHLEGAIALNRKLAKSRNGNDTFILSDRR